MRQGAVPRALLLAGGFAAALLVAEGVARRVPSSLEVHFGLAGEGNREGCVRPSVSRGYEPIPGTCGVNEVGAREHGSSTEAGAVRVMVIGDSISTHLTWPAELAAGLAAGWGRPVTVSAFGVPGYNTCQELSMFQEKVEGAAPEAILLQGCANDARGSPVLFRSGGQVRFHLNSESLEFPEWTLHSRLLTALIFRFAPRTRVDVFQSDKGFAAECLAELRGEAERRGIPLVTALFPLFWQREAAPAPMLQDEDDMRDLLGASGLPFLDLRPAYEAAGPMVDHRFMPSDFIHPNEGGEVLAGAAIAAWMAERVPVPLR